MNELEISIINPYTGKETLPDVENKTKFCPKAYSTQNIYIIDRNGKLFFHYTPCSCFINNKYFDKFASESFSEIINTTKFNSFKKNVLNNNYTECKENECSLYKTYLRGNTQCFYDWESFINETGYYGKKVYYKNYNEVPGPYTISLHISPVCNLQCKTCRDVSQKEYDLSDKYEDIINGLKQVNEVNIGCDGETFMSKVYRYILSVDLTENSSLEKINVFTNGTLMNETALSNIHPNNYKLIKQFRISVDATTENTYNNLRINGNWNTLLKNIKFLKENYATKYDIKLCTVYTISRFNLCDVYNFYDFAKRLGFDEVTYSFAMKQFYGDRVDFILTEEEKKDLNDYLIRMAKKNDVYYI